MTSMDDIGKATGLPDRMVERAIKMLLRDDLCIYATRKQEDGYLANYDPLYEKSLELYWDRTRTGADSNIRYKRCIGCEKGFWSRSATHARCRSCSERKWE